MAGTWTSVAVVTGLAIFAGGVGAQDGLGGPPPAARPGAVREQSLVFTAPAGWKVVEAVEAERWAWATGEAGKDGAPAPLRVAATRVARRPLEAHVARWARGFEDAAGAPLAAGAAKTEELKVDGVPTTLVELRGTFTGAAEPGAEERPRHEGWAALYLVQEGPDGTWVVSARGPAAAIEALRAQLVELARATKPGEVEVPAAAPVEAPEKEGESEEGE